jgi:hypothetical protein
MKGEAAQYASEWKTAAPWNEQAQLAFARLKSDTTLLNDIRRSPDARYSTRVEAARLLRDLNSAAAGTDELALLTQKQISASQAAQPFYVEARLEAAKESAIPAEKIRLYTEAIAIDPQLRDPRLDLAQVALTNGREAFGLAAFESYRMSTYESAPSYESQPRPASVPVGSNVHQLDNLLNVEQLAAEAFNRQHEYGRAVQLYNQILNKTKDPAKRDQIRKARDLAHTKQSLEMANAMRQPLVGNGLTQSRIVKPKLKTLPADWISATAEPGEEH